MWSKQNRVSRKEQGNDYNQACNTSYTPVLVQPTHCSYVCLVRCFAITVVHYFRKEIRGQRFFWKLMESPFGLVFILITWLLDTGIPFKFKSFSAQLLR